MSKNNFNSDIDEEQIIDEIENEEVFGNTTKTKTRSRRKWREIEVLNDRKKLRLELQDLEDYEL